MTTPEIKEMCEKLTDELGIPCFIVFGIQKDNGQYGIVSSVKDAPPKTVIKGLAWALNDFLNRLK